MAKPSVLYSVTAILYFGAPASAMALGLLVAMGAREFIVHSTVGAVYPSVEVYDVSNAIATPDTTRPHTATLSAKSCRRCSAKPLFRIKARTCCWSRRLPHQRRRWPGALVRAEGATPPPPLRPLKTVWQELTMRKLDGRLHTMRQTRYMAYQR